MEKQAAKTFVIQWRTALEPRGGPRGARRAVVEQEEKEVARAVTTRAVQNG